MATDARNRSDEFIPYPTNRVAGTITDSGDASTAVDALVAAGFDRNDIDVLHGAKDLRRLDPDGLSPRASNQIREVTVTVYRRATQAAHRQPTAARFRQIGIRARRVSEARRLRGMA